MTLKKITLVVIVLSFNIVLTGCIKTPVANSSADFLKLSHAMVHFPGTSGASVTVMVESNIAWKLNITTPDPGWMVINKTAGHGSDSLIIKTTGNYNPGDYHMAEIVAMPLNSNAVLPVRLIAVQSDSLYISK